MSSELEVLKHFSREIGMSTYGENIRNIKCVWKNSKLMYEVECVNPETKKDTEKVFMLKLNEDMHNYSGSELHIIFVQYTYDFNTDLKENLPTQKIFQKRYNDVFG